jgi:NAD(P)H dehydrogenase subunit S
MDIRPGMPVKVINRDNIYYGFEGQVQKIIDGKVGVFFLGGNWAKQVSFLASDLDLVEKTTPRKR